MKQVSFKSSIYAFATFVALQASAAEFAGTKISSLSKTATTMEKPGKQDEKANLSGVHSVQKNAKATFGRKDVLRGGVNGGGGTSVRSQRSKALILWDLFANNPTHEETMVGDQIQINPTVELDRIRYVHFKSFELLKGQLELLKYEYPNLHHLITADQFLHGDQTLALYGTTKYVKYLEELFLKYDLKTIDYSALPLAHFDEKTSLIFVNVELWNQMGVQSQAAFLLHERLRHLQMKYPELSNEIVQGIVSFVMNREFAMMMDIRPNDQFFRFETKHTSAPMDSSTALKRYQELVKLGFFISSAVEVKNPANVGKRNTIATDSQDVVIDQTNCDRLISGFESVINTFRATLYCSTKGTLEGTGELYFKTPQARARITVRVTAKLTSSNDGGAEIEMNFFKDNQLAKGIQTKIFNRGRLEFRTNLEGSEKSNVGVLPWEKLLKNYYTYNFSFDRESRKYTVSVTTEEGEVQLISGTISQEIDLNAKENFWSVAINNNSSIQRVEIQ